MPRGVTLLELLLVLVLMAVATALVVPALAPRAPASASLASSLVSEARRTAIRRAEPVQLRLSANGQWVLSAQRDGALIDSGRGGDGLPEAALLIDALGACVPAPSAVPSAEFDPLSCAEPASPPAP